MASDRPPARSRAGFYRLQHLMVQRSSVGDFALRVISGRMRGQRIPLARDAALTLGRSVQSDIQLPDQGISRLHCQIETTENQVEVSDLGSSNGTLVNSQPITRTLLKPGDQIALGASILRLEKVETTAGPAVTRNRSDTSVMLVNDEAGRETAVRKRYLSQTATHFVKDNMSLPQKRLAAMCDMAATIYTEDELQQILDKTTDTILQATQASRSAIVMTNEDGEPEPVSVRTHVEGDAQDFPVSRTIVEEAMRQGVSIISNDATTDDRFKEGASIVMQQIHSVMCAPLRSEERIIGAIYVESSAAGHIFEEEELALLAAVGQQAGVAIERARLVRDLENLFIGAMHTLVATIEAKDTYTRGHSERVTTFALLLARELGLSEEEQSAVELGGVLHDVGKIGVPEAVLRKPGRLTEEEYEIIKKHPVAGATIVENMPEIDRIVDMKETVLAVRHHHERFDGKGYPSGLAGDTIPLQSRILAVADTYDAITSDRPYRKGRSVEDAAQVIADCSRTQFDPDVVDAFTRLCGQGDLSSQSGQVTGRFQLARSRMAGGQEADLEKACEPDRSVT